MASWEQMFETFYRGRISYFKLHGTSSKLKSQVSEIDDGRTNMFNKVLIENQEEVEETKVEEEENVEPGLGRVQLNQTINAFK